jgi:PTH1 family peptidyl-tRNA hydrolase
MILIIGLGNPGEKYEKTRHNLGFVVLDGLLQDLTKVEKTTWKMDKKFNSLMARINDLILVKPQTMMNASGFSVSKLASFYKIKPENIWIVHDDVDLPLGKIKIRMGGGTAGHHGVESVIDKLGTDQFVRFRLGIGHPQKKGKLEIRGERAVDDYVLKEFDVNEASEVKKMIKKAIQAIKIALDKGLEKAMNRFNQ